MPIRLCLALPTCSALTRSDRLVVPPAPPHLAQPDSALVQKCAGPTDLGDKPLEQAQLEKLWTASGCCPASAAILRCVISMPTATRGWPGRGNNESEIMGALAPLWSGRRLECVRMTGAELMAVGGFFLALLGAISAGFWRMYGLIKEEGKEGRLARQELAALQLHCAETFATKAGMRDQTAQLLRAIEAIGSRLDSMSERLDRFVENQPARRTTRS